MVGGVPVAGMCVKSIAKRFFIGTPRPVQLTFIRLRAGGPYAGASVESAGAFAVASAARGAAAKGGGQRLGRAGKTHRAEQRPLAIIIRERPQFTQARQLRAMRAAADKQMIMHTIARILFIQRVSGARD